MPGCPIGVAGERERHQLESLGIIEQVDPQEADLWTSALHLASKADDTLRVSGDFRPLNEKTMLDGLRLPNL